MQHTPQQRSADDTALDSALTDRRLFPLEPPAVREDWVDDDELPLEIEGSEPDPVLIRIAERVGLPGRILVAPAEDQEDGAYRVLEDGRWLQAAREGGMRRHPVRVLDVQGLPAELLVLVLNGQRPANVAAQAGALERLFAADLPEEEIARASGMTKAKVHRLAGLLGLDPILRQALEEGAITSATAFAAAELPELQAELAAEYEREGRLTSTQIRRVRERAGQTDAEAEGGDLNGADREAGGEPPTEPADEDEHPADPPANGDAPAAARGESPGADPALRVRLQARELLDELGRTDFPGELRARLAAVLEDIERTPALAQ
jgi:ParB-like chromosome segregation protein Spo0J